MRTYTKLSSLPTLLNRFDYVCLHGGVGDLTFGSNRYINQSFYHSREWRNVRNYVILRDNGCELGVEEFPIAGNPQIHHLNPLTIEDFEHGTPNLLDPEFLISASQRVHNAIHFGDRTQIPRIPVDRSPGDTILW